MDDVKSVELRKYDDKIYIVLYFENGFMKEELFKEQELQRLESLGVRIKDPNNLREEGKRFVEKDELLENELEQDNNLIDSTSENRKLKLHKKNNFILVGGITAAMLLAIVGGIISSKSAKNKPSDPYVETPLISDELEVDNGSFYNKSFNPNDLNQLNKVLDDYKRVFDERGISVNYKFLEYWILFDNHIFPEEIVELTAAECNDFVNSLFSLVENVAAYNFENTPNDFISLTGFYGKDNPIDAYFVNLSEKYQFEIINSYYYGSEEETARLIEEYFWFQINIIMDNQAIKINNQEINFSSCLIPTKEKVFNNVISLNGFLKELGYLNTSISRIEYNREMREEELTSYNLLDIEDIIWQMYLTYTNNWNAVMLCDEAHQPRQFVK